MVLLKHGNFIFNHILRGGYKILKDKPDVICKVMMGNGSVRRNYGAMPKTIIKVKFGQLDRATYREYISHFILPEDFYTFYDTSTGNLMTKKFAVDRNEDQINYIDNLEEEHNEFEVKLTQVDEVEV